MALKTMACSLVCFTLHIHLQCSPDFAAGLSASMLLPRRSWLPTVMQCAGSRRCWSAEERRCSRLEMVPCHARATHVLPCTTHVSGMSWQPCHAMRMSLAVHAFVVPCMPCHTRPGQARPCHASSHEPRCACRCCAMPCHATSTVLCKPLLCHAMPCRMSRAVHAVAVPCHAMPHQPCCASRCCAMPCHAMPVDHAVAVPGHAVPCHTHHVLQHTMPNPMLTLTALPSLLSGAFRAQGCSG